MTCGCSLLRCNYLIDIPSRRLTRVQAFILIYSTKQGVLCRGGITPQSWQWQQKQTSDKDAPLHSVSNRLQLHCFLFQSVSYRTYLGRCICSVLPTGYWSNLIVCFYHLPWKLTKLYGVADRRISVKRFWNDTDMGKPNYSEIKLSQYNAVLHKCYVDWLSVVPQPLQYEAINHLSNGKMPPWSPDQEKYEHFRRTKLRTGQIPTDHVRNKPPFHRSRNKETKFPLMVHLITDHITKQVNLLLTT